MLFIIQLIDADTRKPLDSVLKVAIFIKPLILAVIVFMVASAPVRLKFIFATRVCIVTICHVTVLTAAIAPLACIIAPLNEDENPLT